MIEIAIPKLEILDAVWPEVEPYFQLAVDESNGEIDIKSIKSKVLKKELLVATIFEDGDLIAVCSFEITNFESGKRVLSIHTAGGSKQELWVKKIDEMASELAKMHNCSHVYIIGRKGWEKIMKPLGYNHTNTIIAKEVI